MVESRPRRGVSQREGVFIAMVLRVLAEADVPFGSEEALALAIAKKMRWVDWNGYTMNEKRAVARAKAHLNKANVLEALRRFFEASTGFSVVDAAREHVKWIRGEQEHDGRRLPPNYGALKDYEAMTLPKLPKQVQVDQRTLVARVNLREEAPAIRPRTLDALPEKRSS